MGIPLKSVIFGFNYEMHIYLNAVPENFVVYSSCGFSFLVLFFPFLHKTPVIMIAKATGRYHKLVKNNFLQFILSDFLERCKKEKISEG